MKNLCTVADNNFLEKVLALNASLKRFQDDYTLHLLCLDDLVYEKFKSFEDAAMACAETLSTYRKQNPISLGNNMQ